MVLLPWRFCFISQISTWVHVIHRFHHVTSQAKNMPIPPHRIPVSTYMMESLPSRYLICRGWAPTSGDRKLDFCHQTMHCNPSDPSTPSCSHFLWKPGTMALRRFLDMFASDHLIGRVTVLGHNGVHKPLWFMIQTFIRWTVIIFIDINVYATC